MKFKTLLGAAALSIGSLLSTTVMANAVQGVNVVGGPVLTSATFTQTFNPQNGTLSGSGSFNLYGSSFNFTFGGFTLDGAPITVPAGGFNANQSDNLAFFKGGFFTILGPQSNPQNPFLTLVGTDQTKTFSFNNTSYTKTFSVTARYFTNASGQMVGSGSSDMLLSVAGGAAEKRFGTFDAASFTDVLGNVLTGGDFQIMANGTTTPSPGFVSIGSASVAGFAIPEPASLALMGLGLLGFGAARRRKAQAA